jgi:hypothetical protein
VRFSRRATLGPLVIGKPKNLENKNETIAQKKISICWQWWRRLWRSLKHTFLFLASAGLFTPQNEGLRIDGGSISVVENDRSDVFRQAMKDGLNFAS